MLPGIGFTELMVLAVAALIIVGPKDLPMMMRRLGQFVGKGRAMAREFVRAHPPSSPLLFLYGQEFPAFMETFEPARSIPYLADVARIERA